MSEFSSRRAQMDKIRAISTAKHPKDSCLGRALLRNNVFEGRLLSGELGKLGEQSRRQQMHLDQQRKLFIKSHTLPEPSILVERAPSPEILRKALFPEYYNDDAYYFDPSMPPHYMKPLTAQQKCPSTMVTMDMFRLQTKKKVNVWEEAMLEKEKPSFQSTVRPSTRLTVPEQEHLQKSWSKLKQQNSPARPGSSVVKKTLVSKSTYSLPERRIKSAAKIEGFLLDRKSKSAAKLKSISGQGTFITELPDFRAEDLVDNDAQENQSVQNCEEKSTSSSNEDTKQVKIRPKSNKHQDLRIIRFNEKIANVKQPIPQVKTSKTKNSSGKRKKKASLFQILIDNDLN